MIGIPRITYRAVQQRFRRGCVAKFRSGCTTEYHDTRAAQPRHEFTIRIREQVRREPTREHRRLSFHADAFLDQERQASKWRLWPQVGKRRGRISLSP